MSGFGKFLAKFGVGAAQVDTRLFNDTVAPGDTVTGEVHVQGGSVAQAIDDIYLYLMTKYTKIVNDTTYHQDHNLAEEHITAAFTIDKGENRVFPLSMRIPYTTPLTYPKTPVFIKTGLNIPAAVDPGDTDSLNVVPTPLMKRVLETAQALGMHLHDVECEENQRLGGFDVPFVQEIEFRPGARYESRATEIEIMLFPKGDRLEALVEIDRRKRGLSRLFEGSEAHEILSFTSEDLQKPNEYWMEQLDSAILRRLS